MKHGLNYGLKPGLLSNEPEWLNQIGFNPRQRGISTELRLLDYKSQKVNTFQANLSFLDQYHFKQKTLGTAGKQLNWINPSPSMECSGAASECFISVWNIIIYQHKQEYNMQKICC